MRQINRLKSTEQRSVKQAGKSVRKSIGNSRVKAQSKYLDEINKGDKIKLRDGYPAIMFDNQRGANIRRIQGEVIGMPGEIDISTVYVSDISMVQPKGETSWYSVIQKKKPKEVKPVAAASYTNRQSVAQRNFVKGFLAGKRDFSIYK